jgi:hypothetical protein
MPYINTKRSCERKKTSSEEVKKIIVYQVEHTGTNRANHQTPAGKNIESQSIIEGKQSDQGKRTKREAQARNHQTKRRILCKKHQKQH